MCHSDASPSTTMRCTASSPLRCPRQPDAIAALPSLSSRAVLTPAASPVPCSRCVVEFKGVTRAACAFPERACMRADLAPTAQKASSRAFLCGTQDPTTHTHAPTAYCQCTYHPCMAACSCHMQQQNPFPRHQPCQTCKCCIDLAGAAARSSVTASLLIRCRVRHRGNPQLGFAIALMPSADWSANSRATWTAWQYVPAMVSLTSSTAAYSVALSCYPMCRSPSPCLAPLLPGRLTLPSPCPTADPAHALALPPVVRLQCCRGKRQCLSALHTPSLSAGKLFKASAKPASQAVCCRLSFFAQGLTDTSAGELAACGSALFKVQQNGF